MGDKMIDTKLAFLISAAGYGITILVIVIISVIIWVITLAVQKWNSLRGERS
jgi:hypothetical protein